MNETNTPTEAYLKTLHEVRDALLDLHKQLLEYQKGIYTATIGPIETPGKYYDLVVNHDSFSWLKNLSVLIISIDENLEMEKPPDVPVIRGVFSYVKKLLTATGHGDTFETNYVTALQKDGQVSVTHGKIMKLLDNQKQTT